MKEYRCPTHGLVMGAPDHARVECQCGAECAPNGYTPAQWRALYLAARRKRDNRSKKPLVTAS